MGEGGEKKSALYKRGLPQKSKSSLFLWREKKKMLPQFLPPALMKGEKEGVSFFLYRKEEDGFQKKGERGPSPFFMSRL